jgi:hypothetical protein
MLMDVLGVAIAFITIILLLSIVVTAGVQASQAVLRLRGRNLVIGLAAALVNQKMRQGEAVGFRERLRAKLDAMKVLSTRSLDPLSGPGVEGSDLFWCFKHYLAGPKVSWIQVEDLPAALTQVGFGAEQIQQIQADFQRLEPHVSKRFEKVARGWSLAWALAVAVLLQVSTPALLRKLAADTEYRQRILASTDSDLNYAGEAMARLDYESAAATALEQLAGRHPELRGRIEQASGVGTNKAFIVEELRLALEGVDQQQKLVEEYGTLLDEAAASEAETVARDALGSLAAYDIGLWPGGSGFYFKQPARAIDNTAPGERRQAGFVPGAADWQNIIGVLITAILLTLGAPFWFDRLRDIVGLRDRLASKTTPGPPAGGGPAAGDGAPAAQPPPPLPGAPAAPPAGKAPGPANI